MNRWRVVIYVFILAAAGLAVWGNTFKNGFLYDDDTFIVLNDDIKTLTPLSKYIAPDTTSNNPQMNRDVWRPLTTFSYAISYALSGLSPRAFHAQNVVLHVLNALLVFWLIFLILVKRARPLAPSRAQIVAFLSALIFLLHPVQAETVCWVSQRSNLLFFFFYLAAYMFYLRRSSVGFFLSLTCYVCSLLSKEMAVTLPLTLCLHEWILEGRPMKRVLFNGRLWFFGAITILFMGIRSAVLGQTAQTVYWAGGLLPQMLTMTKGFIYYMKLIVIPYPLSVEYLFPIKIAMDGEVLMYFFILAAVVYFALRVRWTKPLISFGMLFLFVSLGPVSNIIPIRTLINERFLYMGMMGFGMVLASGLALAWDSGSRRTLPLILTALLVLYGGISFNRGMDWKDHWSMVTANLKTCPQSATLHFGMGMAYASKGQYDKAAEEFELCLRIDPQFDRILDETGLTAAANKSSVVRQYRQTVQKRVDLFEALHQLGVAFINGGRYAKAANVLEKACQVKPDHLEAKTNLASAYAYSGDLEKAVQLCQAVLAVNPFLDATRKNVELFLVAMAPPASASGSSSIGKRIEKEFTDSWIKDKVMRAGPWEMVKNGEDAVYTPLSELPGTPSGMKPEEVEALEAMATRDCETCDVKRETDKQTTEAIAFLPEKYSEPMTIHGSQWAINIKPATGRLSPAIASLESSGIAYAEAYEDVDMFYVHDQGGVEQLFFVKKPQRSDRFAFYLESRGDIKGFRLNHEGELDALDDEGCTIMQLSKPLVVDADGRRADGWYELDCMDQTSDTRRQKLVLCFNDAGLRYPLLIDPVWRNTTNNMSSNRGSHTATLLLNGKVLLAGGHTGSTFISTAQLFDPSTNSFLTVAPMKTIRCDHVATLLPNGKVLITGGRNGSTYWSTAELFDPNTLQFTLTDSMSTTRAWHNALLLKNGKVLVTGGLDNTADLFDPLSETFTPSANVMISTRAGHTTALLPDGNVLLAGGNGGTSYLSTAEIYNVADDSFTATANAMSSPRNFFSAILLPNGKVLLSGGRDTISTYLSTADLYDTATGLFSGTAGTMTTGTRSNHASTLLPNGKVLIAGGYNGSSLSTVLQYDPETDTFSTVASLTTARYNNTATLLPNGKVFVAGGYLSTAQLYDPLAGTFASTTGPMSSSREFHTATLLPNGKVLITGGTNGTTLSTAELYQPESGTFSTTGNLTYGGRRDHTGTLLPNGRVLVVGGVGEAGVGVLSTAELFDPAYGTFSTTGGLAGGGRYGHTATLLPNGKVLVMGGTNSVALSTAELYDPISGTFSTTGSLVNGERKYHSATLLSNGKVLVAGGRDNDDLSINTAELYNPAMGSFSTTGNLTGSGRYYHTATLLPNGKVLLAGGEGNLAVPLSTAELYDPTAGTFSTTGSLTDGTRKHHTATLLPNGKVLVAGGYRTGGYLSSVELYDPDTKTFGTTTPLTVNARMSHMATLLPNGQVLITGGYNGSYLSSAELARYTEYDYTTYASTMQPSVTSVNGQSDFPVAIDTGTVYSITGQRFKGAGEGDGGSYNTHSPAHFPRVYIQRMDTGGSGLQTDGNWLIDVSSSVYPLTAAQWQNADTQISFKVPDYLGYGYYILRVVANAVPSDGKVFVITTQASYLSRVGNAADWEWDSPQLGDTVPSGAADDWEWRAWQPGSGRSVPKGDATDWNWGSE